MIPAPYHSASWVGKIVVCNECGRGWELEEGDKLTPLVGKGRHGRRQYGVSVVPPLPCNHVVQIRGDEYVRLMEPRG